MESQGKRPQDIPDVSELPKMSAGQLEDLWIRVGMIKEALEAEDTKRKSKSVKD